MPKAQIASGRQSPPSGDYADVRTRLQLSAAPLAMHKTVDALASPALSLACARVQFGPRLLTDSPVRGPGYGYQGPRVAGYRPVTMHQAPYWVSRRETPRGHGLCPTLSEQCAL
jgi:hypothetical protein